MSPHSGSTHAPPLADLLDFEIRVRLETEHVYRVDTSAHGGMRSSSLSHFDPDADWLLDLLFKLDQVGTSMCGIEQEAGYLLTGAEGVGRAGSNSSHSPRAHGLLQGLNRDAFEDCLRDAFGPPPRMLRIWLDLEPPELAAIPWEYAFDRHQHHFYAAFPRFSLVRIHSRKNPLASNPYAPQEPAPRHFSFQLPPALSYRHFVAPFRALMISSASTDLDVDGE